jgi:NhaA family Na+:H+ antiporter
MEAAGSTLLLVSTAIALVWANSPWEPRYHAIWNTPAFVGFGRFSLSESRHVWVNDGLMSIFFFLVGLEIKREILVGELSSLKQAAFPFISALGGTIIPALIYTSVNMGKPSERGWGIPMATDIAFAIGILTLLGNRVPISLKVFVTALAIVDDMLAVLVVAVFYTSQIDLLSLAAAGAGIAVSIAANLLGVHRPLIYALIGVCIWFAVLKSGLHATVAGVLLAFTIPARTSLDRNRFLVDGRSLLERFAVARPGSDEEHAVISRLERQCEMFESPLQRIEHRIQPWVSFLVMPLFAFANAGVHLLGKVTLALTHPVTLGVALGLLVGKPIGIFSFAWCSVKAKLTICPANVSWRQILGAGWLCGIGFTMSLFIATLAFGEGWMLDLAKIGTLGASVVAGVGGGLLLSLNSSLASDVRKEIAVDDPSQGPLS